MAAYTWATLRDAINSVAADTDTIGTVRIDEGSGHAEARVSRYQSTDPANPSLVVLTITNG
jgi:hypothetical protein